MYKCVEFNVSSKLKIISRTWNIYCQVVAISNAGRLCIMCGTVREWNLSLCSRIFSSWHTEHRNWATLPFPWQRGERNWFLLQAFFYEFLSNYSKPPNVGHPASFSIYACFFFTRSWSTAPLHTYPSVFLRALTAAASAHHYWLPSMLTISRNTVYGNSSAKSPITYLTWLHVVKNYRNQE